MPMPGSAHWILGEVEGATGIALWRALTDAELWVCSEGAEGLFWMQAPIPDGVDSEVRESLEVLAMIASHAGGVARPELAQAATRIWEWSERREYRKSALLFAELAARLEPESSVRASTAGRLCRPVHDYVRGTRWYIRAARLARWAGRDKEFSIAHLGWGNMEADLGRFAEAEFHATKAYRAALRVGLRSLAASAYHDLLAISIHKEHYEAAWLYARDAVAMYKIDHPRFPALAHDVAFLWGKLGLFSSALPVYLAVLPRMSRRNERLVVLANIARAAAAAHDRLYFERAKREVLRAMEEDSAVSATPLYHLARACQTYEEWPLAEKLCELALASASERWTPLALELRRSIAAREAGDVDVLPPDGGDVDAVRDTLLRRLAKHGAGSVGDGGDSIPPERYPIT
jgi:tetratricopeptide (TPR) repeat protein